MKANVMFLSERISGGEYEFEILTKEFFLIELLFL